ncbi:hypothetical protein [Aliiroseovarius sp. F20344]|uniref:hypothetical protein n=1 Tax=Aliiroseovarius sp. F20344 TaxID=2926414 RepID=UPI001FF1BDCF|nr:hypothetical protein [Aliiroseovarius sp. F20344]MCK0141092.1 hypothetical protein [Aliiroseovarius sp. F20344]
MTRNTPFLAIAVLVATVAFALSPFLTRDFAGYRPEQFPVVLEFWPVQPAGWAFSIWGVIYIWLIAGAVWGGLNASHDPHWRKMRTPLLISLGLGTFWITAANAAPVLATVMIFAMAVFAIVAMLRAGYEDRVWQVRPVALYAGWLTAATGVGTGVVLSGYGVLSAQAAALTMLAVVLLAALAVQSCRPSEWAYPTAIIWALSGVIAANVPTGNWPVIALSAAGIAALTVGFVLQRRKR